MTKGRCSLVTLLLIVAANSATCQNLRRNYVVFTFESCHKVSQHGREIYYWIQPVDSLKQNSKTLSALFLSGLSKNNLDDCCKGNDVNPFRITSSTSYSFDSEYLLKVDSLKALISKNRQKVQTIKKVWPTGQKEVVEVFATPVSGIFCNSKFLNDGLYSSFYNGYIYIANSNFSYLKSFWNSEEGKLLFRIDYSNKLFSVFPSN